MRSKTCDAFLSTLDKFNITSPESGDKNYLETEQLEKYWAEQGYGLDE